MDLHLKNKTAFISGSTSGIGYTTAKILLQEGMKVYINGRSQKNLKKSLDQLKKDVKGANVYGIKADFLDQKDVHKIVNKLEEVDVLINNVGIYTSKSFFENIIWLYGDKRIIFRQKLKLTVNKMSKFSIIPLSDLSNLSIDGAEWNLENKNIQFGETTTLRNVANKDEINVNCDTGVFAFIY